jgi:hypothetical protein
MRDPWETDDSVEEVPSVNAQRAMPRITVSTDPLVRLQTVKTDSLKENQDTHSTQYTAKSAKSPLGLLTFNRDNLLQGIIWAEIIGEPLSKRGRR